MYSVISEIIGHVFESADFGESYIAFISGAIIIVLTAVFVDMVYQTFSRFWRK